MSNWKAEYSATLRNIAACKGRPVKFIDPDNEFPEFRVSTYGWCDWDAMEHIREDGCAWVVDDGATVEELTYSEFQDTFSGNNDTVGVNVTPARCACGKYAGITLRVEGSFGQMLKDVLPLRGTITV